MRQDIEVNDDGQNISLSSRLVAVKLDYRQTDGMQDESPSKHGRRGQR